MAGNISIAFEEEIRGTIVIRFEDFGLRNESLEKLWARFFAEHRRADDSAQLAYHVHHLTEEQPFKGTACLLAAVGLGFAQRFPPIATVIRRTCCVARAHCEFLPNTGRCIAFGNFGINFYQNDLGLEKLLLGVPPEANLRRLLATEACIRVRKILGVACGEKLYESLPLAVSESFLSFCRQIQNPQREFRILFDYLAFRDEGARLGHKHKTLKQRQVDKLPEREECVRAAIRAADHYLAAHAEDLAH